MPNRLTVLKLFLWALVGVLAAVTWVRFTQGLGAVTNLSDVAPWGLWKVFNVLAGIALAAGGFVMAASVYIFGLEKYRPYIRPAILMALLGYTGAGIGLFFDIGLPWRIWHPMIYWQHHSVLFEVAMCVMIYLTVLSLEFAPVVLEHPVFGHPFFQRILRILRKIVIPLVITGIVVSTVHQSSLGSLFLIAPHRVHPLWYSPIIYLLFFFSAVGLAMMAVTLQAVLAQYFFGYKVKTDLLPGVGIAASVVLWIYLGMRLGDLAVRGILPMALNGTWQSNVFLIEILLTVILPATLLLFPKVRSSVAGTTICAVFTVLGVVGYRLNLSIVTFAMPEGYVYFPSWAEFAISLGIIACLMLVFLFFVERLKVYDEPVHLEDPHPSHDAATIDGLLPTAQAAPRRYSLVAVSAAAIALLFLPVQGVGPVPTPTYSPRAVDGFQVQRLDSDFHLLAVADRDDPSPATEALIPLYTIDGNRDGTLVLFNHAGHIEREGNLASCAICHHLNMPFDRATSCTECHSDMYEPTSLFNHSAHVAKLDGNAGCSNCHSEEVQVKSMDTATACSRCHQQPAAPLRIIPPAQPRWRDAPGYMDAMHQACLKCHTYKAQQQPARYGGLLFRCDACHDTDTELVLSRMAPARTAAAESDARQAISTGGGK
jgi:Ni/Fe-hydrogenase subunit HybB-like protein